MLRPEVLKEAAVAESLQEALSLLRESSYPGLAEARSASQASQTIWATYFKIMGRLIDLAPPSAAEALRALLLEEDLRDSLSIYQLAILGKVVEERLPSYYMGNSVTRSLYEDPDALASPQKIEELVRGSDIEPYFMRAAAAYAELKGGPAALWATPMAIARLYVDAVEKERDVEDLFCPRIEEKIFSSLLLSRAFDVSQRLVELLLPDKPTCGIDRRSLLAVYSSEPEPVAMAGELRGLMRHVRPEGRSLDEILFSARKSSRQQIAKTSQRLFAGYPFRAAFVLAGALMLKTEIENVLFIISSKERQVPAEKILQGLGLEA